VKPGIVTGELYKISHANAKSLGYEEQFLGPPGYKVTFIGHAVGLELVEAPVIAQGQRGPFASWHDHCFRAQNGLSR